MKTYNSKLLAFGNMENMTIKNSSLLLSIILLVSCKNIQNQTETSDTTRKTIVLTDSSRDKLESGLKEIITSNSTPDDITINARFVDQGKNVKGNSYITIKTENDSLITLTNPMPIDETDIAKLKKDGNNITVTYTALDKTVKFLAANYEPEK